MNVHFSSKTDLWTTPQLFYDELNAEFSFTLDPCALPENAKCQQYFTPEINGLKQDWGAVMIPASGCSYCPCCGYSPCK